MPTTAQLIEEAVDRYEEQVSKLADDTGYWDHDFVKSFLKEELATIATKSAGERTMNEQKNLHYFSRLIIAVRKKLGESGTVFGSRFGVTHAAVSDWENGKSEASWEVLYFCLMEADELKSQPKEELND